ncbi:MAG: hypothetical protein ACWA5U_04170 [bacterium]
MLDLALKYELVLLASIALMIAWLMGWTLCRSKEYKVRTTLKQQEQENQRIEKILLKKDQIVAEQYDKINNIQKALVDKTHEYTMIERSYQQLEKTHHETTKQLQSYESNRVKLNTLSEQYDEQAIELLNIKKVYHSTQHELQQCRDNHNKQQQTLEKYKVDYAQLAGDNQQYIKEMAQLNKKNETLEQSLIQQEQVTQTLEKKLNKAKSINETLDADYQHQKKEALSLKHGWHETKDELAACKKQLTQQQLLCEQLQEKNKILTEDLQAYEILSTIR